jgi:hypothetical protein
MCMCVHMPVCACVHVCAHVHVCARVHVCACVHVCARVHVCACVHVCARVHMHVEVKRIMLGSQCSLSTLWILRLKLEVVGLGCKCF